MRHFDQGLDRRSFLAWVGAVAAIAAAPAMAATTPFFKRHGLQLGVRRFFVEQEPPFERSRLEAVKLSYDFLARLDV